MKSILYITGTRADFGLMSPVLHAIQESKKLRLDLYVTGMHCMSEFGLTVKEVKKQFPAVRVLDVRFEDDTRESTVHFISQFTEKLVYVLSKRKPDLVLLLGDRPEMLATAVACLYLGIPTGHIHGGELTATVDDSARHAITKLASIHFTATKEAARRIRAMGEESKRIHMVGAPAYDILRTATLPPRKEKENFLLLTMHPSTGDTTASRKEMRTVIDAVASVGMPVVAIYPNADAGGRAMIKELEKKRHSRQFKIFRSLPYEDFLALVRDARAWIGNSSGMMIESPFFGIPVVNIGMRQSHRERGNNVIDVGCEEQEISEGIQRVLKRGHRTTKHPWGDGHAAERIVNILEKLSYENLEKTSH